jgi:hypothetical protein
MLSGFELLAVKAGECQRAVLEIIQTGAPDKGF